MLKDRKTKGIKNARMADNAYAELMCSDESRSSYRVNTVSEAVQLLRLDTKQNTDTVDYSTDTSS